MAITAPSLDNLTLDITDQVHVRASLEATFDSILAQMGRLNETPDGKPLPLPGLDALVSSVSADVKGIESLTQEIIEQRKQFDTLSTEVVATEKRLLAMNAIRDSVQAELFFLSTFEVNAFETRETVLRRDRQLRNRLKALGASNP